MRIKDKTELRLLLPQFFTFWVKIFGLLLSRNQIGGSKSVTA